MKYGQRAGSIALAVLLTSATWTVFRAEAQQPKGGAAPIASSTAATVNGEKITRAEVFDDVIQEQIAHLNTANNASADQDHITAASVGALLLDRMEANNGRPVTVTRNDMMNWIFKDNPQT